MPNYHGRFFLMRKEHTELAIDPEGSGGKITHWSLWETTTLRGGYFTAFTTTLPPDTLELQKHSQLQDYTIGGQG
jgi:hypothetical protein